MSERFTDNLIARLTEQLKARVALLRFCKEEAATHRKECLRLIDRIELAKKRLAKQHQQVVAEQSDANNSADE